MAAVKTYYKNGVLKSINKIHPNGKPFGEDKIYYENGQLHTSCRRFLVGDFTQVYREYDKNWVLRLKKNYIRSQNVVNIRKYNESGKQISLSKQKVK